MSIESIASIGTAAIGSDAVASVAETAFPAQTQGAGSFDGILTGLDHLNTQLLQSQDAVVKMALDPTDNLHHAVIGMERTRLSFELMLALRNKAMDAYQELMRMQV